jgi:predicted HAD superfamily Cof-like phosphohydrolase
MNHKTPSSSNSLFDDVAEFQVKILGIAAIMEPKFLESNDFEDAIYCLNEEIDELQDAQEIRDIVGVADALADLIYFALGTAYKMGLPFNEIWDAVHRTNMSKVRGITKRGHTCDARKPDGWVGPEAEIHKLIFGAQ